MCIVGEEIWSLSKCRRRLKPGGMKWVKCREGCKWGKNSNFSLECCCCRCTQWSRADFDEWWNVDNIEAAAVAKTEKLSSSRREITILFRTAELLISGVSVRSFWMAFPQKENGKKCSWDENSNERIQRRNVVRSLRIMCVRWNWIFQRNSTPKDTSECDGIFSESLDLIQRVISSSWRDQKR